MSLIWVTRDPLDDHLWGDGWFDIKTGESHTFPTGVLVAGNDVWFTAVFRGQGDCLNFQGKADSNTPRTEDSEVADTDVSHIQPWHFANKLLVEDIRKGKWPVSTQFVGPIRGHRGVRVIPKGNFKNALIIVKPNSAIPGLGVRVQCFI